MADLTEPLLKVVGEYGCDRDEVCNDCADIARDTVTLVLKTLVEKAFPNDDVDYHYACETLTEDAADTYRALVGER